jgi:DNA-binding PucR family transcriptional regulator
MPIAPGYVALVCTLIVGVREGARGGDSLAEVVGSLDMPRGAIFHTTDPTTLVTLWPADSAAAAEAARDFVMRLNTEAISRSGTAKARVRAGIGGYHTGLRGVSRSYLEAQQALETGRKLRPDAVVYRHDEVIPYLVMAQNPVLAERFVNDSLGPLLNPSTRGREQLLDTLEAYLGGGSIKHAASALNLHRHTVLYRLDRLRELLGPDLDQPATRLRLQLALDLRKVL